MNLKQTISVTTVAIALSAGCAGAFQIVVPSCYLLGRSEQHFIEYRDYPVPEQNVLDYFDHKFLKEHPNALSAYADPHGMIALYDKMIKETYSHPSVASH